MKAYLLEFEKGAYNHNYTDKTVLDIGGFCGESAVFFKKKGAKKIIIYEPVKAHHQLIRQNIAMNSINAELHEEGIGEKDAFVNINFDEVDLGFGLLSKGNKQIEIKIKNVQDVIRQCQADIAKIDCEGAEISLLSVPKEVLGLIKVYIVETHSKEIESAIIKKFTESGFIQTREPEQLFGETASINHFEKI